MSTGAASGARICVLSASGVRSDEFEEFVARVVSLGGSVADCVEDATHCCLVAAGAGRLLDATCVSAELRAQLLRARRCMVPVLEVGWLDAVAALRPPQHWSELPLEAHVPPVMALLEDDERDVGRQERQKRQRTRRTETAPALSRSLDETWSYLTREQPEEVEGHELRRALELSLLDCAVALRRTVGSGSGSGHTARAPARRPEEVLGVRAGATAEEAREAFKRRALECHPDKGGRPGDFEALLLAYRTLTGVGSRAAGDAAKAPEPSGECLALMPVVARDEGLREHRALIEEIFERHGSDVASFTRRQELALGALGLAKVDLGASNQNEGGQLVTNQCFYLSLAASYLGVDAAAPPAPSLHDGGPVLLLHETALHLKRVIEAAVLRAHPEWAGSRVGEEVQAFSDFLFFVLDSPTLLSELAVAIFDAESGFVEVYCGKGYRQGRSDPELRANCLTIRYTPGHYQALVGPSRPTLDEICKLLDANEVLYVLTDG
eukprot:TRINITY_DN29374_c0_g1_i1.p1 TRINITY_DN29374_c0_g1~~TRINITY_DN29374_c0_g1_i1.p1  ORF type:complete len:495 (-),score=118.10 TRINITY_DN29374_c0_g1_i1:11-1495(-)